ncbi:phenazine biosynthesis-like protein [Colletotrichum paranaense]|uniref:Phenazine biosynthesis-like protein n=1 Tax=Colletotrichum paranaense TaxID=1914294 RepID=A0ABQ9S1K8_9PEZI|nr:phenazine biosynthesis-like protein [Colletotrichum paranaense]KAK1522684.1 phenazine biosynthesis-like protein [Colletotrichum paranaense]
MELPYTTVDVFTDKPFEGNPLAIVTIPASISLTQGQKQTIAREFNYSETTFVHEVDDPASTERRFDIFTPTAELPFAGHPTVGTAIFLKSRGVKKLIAKAGPIEIEETGSESVRAAIPHNTHLHQKRLRDLGPGPYSNATAELANAEVEAPVFSIVNGMTFALVELPSLASLASAKIGPMEFRQQELLDEGWRKTFISRYYFVRLGAETIDGRVVHKIRTRLIEPDLEDPATGSAACALSSYLSLHEFSEDSLSFEITQGVEMGRRSDIYVDAKLGRGTDGTRKLETLHLGGTATKVMSGTIFLKS